MINDISFIRQSIIKFYKSKEFIPELPTNPERRLFKGLNASGNWVCNVRKVRSVKHLKNWIIKNELIDVFYSKNEFLNPTRLTIKKSVVDTLRTRKCDVIDIDEDYSVEGLRKAADFCLHLSLSLPVENVLFTGSKGFRLDLSKPLQNHKVYKLKGYSNIDKHVLTQEFQIVRVCGTINSKSGMMCQKVRLEDLHKELKQYLKFPILEMPLPLESRKKADDRGGEKPLSPTKNSCGIERPSIISSHITNQCGNRFCAFIKSKFKRKKLIRQIQETYDLGNVYCFKDEEFYYWISPRTYSYRRLEKVLKASKSVNLKQLQKFKKTFLKVSPELKYLTKLVNPTKSFKSKEHTLFLSMYDEVDLTNLHKPKSLKIITTLKK